MCLELKDKLSKEWKWKNGMIKKREKLKGGGKERERGKGRRREVRRRIWTGV